MGPVDYALPSRLLSSTPLLDFSSAHCVSTFTKIEKLKLVVLKLPKAVGAVAPPVPLPLIQASRIYILKFLVFENF